MSDFFSADELEQLRAHGIVIFANRVIFDAQPPMPAEQIAAVQAQCAGPIPPALLALWQQTAGGDLDYDLSLPMNGGNEAISWCELFWNGSESYHDLQGWIDHEKEIQSEGKGESGPLQVLPFGGFEYTDRIYVVVQPGNDQGHILAWKQGLPPVWRHVMHEDGLATIATDLHGALAALHLRDDPLAQANDPNYDPDYFTGQALLDYVDERHGEHGLDLALADKLIDFYRRAVLDWRTPLAEGTLAQSPLLAQAALLHAIANDDDALTRQITATGVALDQPLQGHALATDLALSHGAPAVAHALLDANASVQSDALDDVEVAISPELATALLQRGVTPSTTAVAQCVACGAPDAARLIAKAYAQQHDDLPTAFETARSALLADMRSVFEGEGRSSFTHNIPAETLLKRIEHLEDFRL